MKTRLILATLAVLAVGWYSYHYYISNIRDIKLAQIEKDIIVSEPTRDSNNQVSMFDNLPALGDFPADMLKVIELNELDNLRKYGISNNTIHPVYELFVFGDLTEVDFSGHILSEVIPSVLDAYPNQVKIWYINSVLPYRDNEKLRSAISTQHCLNEQNAFWSNIQELVRVSGLKTGQYVVNNQTQLQQCLTNSRNDNSQDVTISQKLMSQYEINAVPTTIFTVSSNQSKGLLIPGAVRDQVYKDIIEKLLLPTSRGEKI